MSQPNDNRPQPVKPIRGTVLPPIEVDFMQWEGDEEVRNRPAQPAKSLVTSLPPQEVEWMPVPSLHIELRLEPDTAPAVAFQFAMDLMQAITAAAPELQLKYNQEQSRLEDGVIFMVLTPQVFVKDETPLRKLVERINTGFPLGRANCAAAPQCQFEARLCAA